jgi:hypothetical protein
LEEALKGLKKQESSGPDKLNTELNVFKYGGPR